MAVVKKLAKAAAIRTGAEADTVLREFLEGASVAIRKANARAHIKRRSQVSSAAMPALLPEDILAAGA